MKKAPFIKTAVSADIIYYRQDGDMDKVSGNTMSSTSQSPAFLFDWTTFEIARFEPSEVIIDDNGAVVCLPEIDQLCQDSENPQQWTASRGVLGDGTIQAMEAVPTGNTKGCFTEVLCSDYGNAECKMYPWESLISGSPTDRLYVNLIYKLDAGQTFGVVFIDVTASTSTYLFGYRGGLIVVSNNVAANAVITSQTVTADKQYIVKFNVLFNNLNNDLRIGCWNDSVGVTTLLLYGCDVSHSPLIHTYRISNNSGRGEEINSTNNWALLNVTYENDLLTFDSTGEDSPVAQLAQSDLFVSGEYYELEYEVVTNADDTYLYLSDLDFGFSAEQKIPYTVGIHKIKILCTLAGGRLRIFSGVLAPSIVAITDVSCSRIVGNNFIQTTRKNTISNWYGPADGVNLVPNGDFETVPNTSWAAYPNTTLYSSAIVHSGIKAFLCVTTANNGGMASSTFTTVTDVKYEIILWVYPKIDPKPLAIGVRNGDDSGWACVKSLSATGAGVILNAWNKFVFPYTETAGGSNAYFSIYNSGDNLNSFIVDDVSVKSISKPTMQTAYPALYKSNTNGNLSFTWIPSHAYTDAVAGYLLYSGDFYLGWNDSGGVYFTDGVNTATVAGVNWAAEDEVTIQAIYGPDYNFFGANQMKLTVNGVDSDKENLIPSFSFGSFMTWLNNESVNRIKNLIVKKLKQSDW